MPAAQEIEAPVPDVPLYGWEITMRTRHGFSGIHSAAALHQAFRCSL
jgi:hypothetical protein